MDGPTREFVRSRAAGLCEYCRIPQRFFAQLFQIEHVVALSHGGADDVGNAALACRRCNLHKGPNLSGIDPLTGELTPLFHPRSNVWAHHFCQLESGELVGLTEIGRTTIRVLAMNSLRRVELRRAIYLLEHPDP